MIQLFANLKTIKIIKTIIKKTDRNPYMKTVAENTKVFKKNPQFIYRK